MNQKEAMKTLAAAGKGAKAQELINRHSKRAAGTYDYVRSDAGRTETWTRWQLACAYKGVRKAFEDELFAEARRVIVIDRDDAGTVFGTNGIAGDPASLVISRRDAADRVAGITDQSELRDLLKRATRSGDEVLARAVAERATEIRSSDVMNAFLEDRPDLDAAANRLWNQDQADSASFNLTMQTASLYPSELFGMGSDSIVDMADAGEPAAQRA